MKTTMLACALTAALIPLGALAEGAPISDADFTAKAAVGNTFEIEESKVALDKATDPRLKAFAQHMIDDHGKALKALQEAAGKANLPADAKLDTPHQAMLDNLKSFSGTDFDKIYTADQVQAHADTANLLLDYKQNGKNSDLKTWTDKTLPAVQDHQKAINAM